MSGGVPRSSLLGAEPVSGSDLFFMQISDSHIGFDKAENTDVTATMRAASAKINALPVQPAFLLHTGDITQLSKPSEFDTADQVLLEARAGKTFFVPGEHDVSVDGGASYLDRYGKGTHRARVGGGWYSFDHSGGHFMGLVNVLDLKAGGLGSLGTEQLDWIEKGVKHLSSSTPIVVFAHVPLWSVYPAWGWGTDDGARALSYLKHGNTTGNTTDNTTRSRRSRRSLVGNRVVGRSALRRGRSRLASSLPRQSGGEEAPCRWPNDAIGQ